MKRQTALPVATALLFCLLASTAMWGQAVVQHSLGDVARQKSSVKARRVITNDEIPPSPEANKVPSPTSSTSKPEEAPAPSGADQPEPKNSESSEQADLQQFTIELARLRKIIKDLEGKIAATTDPQRKATLGEVVQHAKDSLRENERQIDKLTAGDAAANPPAANSPAPPSVK
jgi:hypothetical protein